MSKPKIKKDIFSSRPPQESMPVTYQLLRVPAKGISGAVVLSHDVVGLPTHYWAGRTKPCPGDDCPACEKNKAPQWRGYLFVLSRRTGEIICLELTPAAMRPVDDAFNRCRTLRGLEFKAWRANDEKTGKLHIQLSQHPVKDSTLPKAPSQKKFLARVFQVNFVESLEVITDEMIKARAAGEVISMNKKLG